MREEASEAVATTPSTSEHSGAAGAAGANEWHRCKLCVELRRVQASCHRGAPLRVDAPREKVVKRDRREERVPFNFFCIFRAAAEPIFRIAHEHLRRTSTNATQSEEWSARGAMAGHRDHGNGRGETRPEEERTVEDRSKRERGQRSVSIHVEGAPEVSSQNKAALVRSRVIVCYHTLLTLERTSIAQEDSVGGKRSFALRIFSNMRFRSRE